MYFVLLFYIFYPHLTSEEMEQICQETDLLFTKEDLNCIDRQRGKRVYSDRGREQDYGRCIEVTATTMISNTEVKQNFLKEAPSDDVIAISERLMKQNIHAYELLAK